MYPPVVGFKTARGTPVKISQHSMAKAVQRMKDEDEDDDYDDFSDIYSSDFTTPSTSTSTPKSIRFLILLSTSPLFPTSTLLPSIQILSPKL